MGKLLEIREFDYITYNKEYINDASYKYLDSNIFLELENLILSFTKGSDTEALEFFKITVKRNVGKVIQTKNYVGLIQLSNGFQIQILPKIYFSDIEDTKKTFLRMLRSMKDFPNKIFNDANLKMDKMNLYEIFINMYIQEVRSLVKKGIRSAYLSFEDNLNYYKSKLIVQEHIKRNLIHKERFYVGYDEFGKDRPENRLIKSTLLKLHRISSSAINMKEIKQLLSSFEMVEPSNNYIKDFSKVVIDRNTQDYETIIRWSRVFLMNQSFTTFSGDTTARALLFPMEKVFEAYVARNLKKVLSDLDWLVSLHDRSCYLFDKPRKFALRPDIFITPDNKNMIILDTKWKSLVNNPSKNYGISQADMYQMYAYSKKYETPEIWLLYPMNEEMKDNDNIQFKSDDDVLVRLFFVDVTNIKESLEKLKTKLIKEAIALV